MKEEKKDFIILLDDLCNIYKNYLKENSESNLEVLVEDNMIDIKLYKDRELVDQFGLTFKQKEREQYIYICVCLMRMLFSGGIVFSKDNVFYKNMDCTGLKIVVNDKDIFNRMFCYKSIDMINYDKDRKIRNKINKTENINIMNNRVNVSKKLVRSKK